jgi:hypothetical protein
MAGAGPGLRQGLHAARRAAAVQCRHISQHRAAGGVLVSASEDGGHYRKRQAVWTTEPLHTGESAGPEVFPVRPRGDVHYRQLVGPHPSVPKRSVRSPRQIENYSCHSYRSLCNNHVCMISFQFSNAPINSRDPMCARMIYHYAAQYALHRPVALSVHLPRTAPEDVNALSDVCMKHSIIDLYIWLSFRFPDLFVEREEALKLKAIAIQMIESALESSLGQMRFSHEDEYRLLREKVYASNGDSYPPLSFGEVRQVTQQLLKLKPPSELCSFPLRRGAPEDRPLGKFGRPYFKHDKDKNFGLKEGSREPHRQSRRADVPWIKGAEHSERQGNHRGVQHPRAVENVGASTARGIRAQSYRQHDRNEHDRNTEDSRIRGGSNDRELNNGFARRPVDGYQGRLDRDRSNRHQHFRNSNADRENSRQVDSGGSARVGENHRYNFKGGNNRHQYENKARDTKARKDPVTLSSDGVISAQIDSVLLEEKEDSSRRKIVSNILS